MKKLSSTRILAALAAFALLAFAGTALQAEQVTLVGELVQDDAGDYLLVEESSGDSIAVRASSDLPMTALSDHVGHRVQLTGDWIENEDSRYFVVSKVEPSSEE
jgi:hypothetical protein